MNIITCVVHIHGAAYRVLWGDINVDIRPFLVHTPHELHTITASVATPIPPRCKCKQIMMQSKQYFPARESCNKHLRKVLQAAPRVRINPRLNIFLQKFLTSSLFNKAHFSTAVDNVTAQPRIVVSSTYSFLGGVLDLLSSEDSEGMAS
jgi:hypothetical protein